MRTAKQKTGRRTASKEETYEQAAAKRARRYIAATSSSSLLQKQRQFILSLVTRSSSACGDNCWCWCRPALPQPASGLDLTRSQPPRCPTPRTTYTHTHEQECNSAPVGSRNRYNKRMNYGILHNHNSNDSAVYKSSLLHRSMEEERIRIVMAVHI